jgi:ABC-type uncharacterized transport system ATPase subunit
MNSLIQIWIFYQHNINILYDWKNNLEIIIPNILDTIQDINDDNIEIILKTIELQEELSVINYLIIHNQNQFIELSNLILDIIS